MGFTGKIKSRILIVAALLSGVACSYNDRKIVFHPNERKTEVIPGLDFEAVKTQVLEANPQRDYCVRCHSWAADYNQVKGKLEDIRSRVQSGDMPRGQTLPAEKKALLLAWIDSGAPLTTAPPEGGAGDEPAPEEPAPEEPAPTEPDALNFATMKAKFFEPACVRCHAWTTNYESVAKSIDDIVFQIDMGFMPKGGSLTEEQKTLLSDWIEAGLPE